MERGVGRGWLFKGGDYFQYFHQRGAFWYSREAINGGTAIIQGNMVLIPLSRDFICAEFLVRPWFGDFISRMGVSVFEWLLRKGVPWVDHCPPSSVSREWAQSRPEWSAQSRLMVWSCWLLWPYLNSVGCWCSTTALVLELHPVFLSIKKKNKPCCFKQKNLVLSGVTSQVVPKTSHPKLGCPKPELSWQKC